MLTAGLGFVERLAELAGHSVLVATDQQLASAAALMELDGLVRRLVLYTPDITSRYLPMIVANTGVDTIVSDRATPERQALGIDLRLVHLSNAGPSDRTLSRRYQTEWVLLTSGTTGEPKAVVHSLASLTAAIRPADSAGSPIIWATFYDIRRY
ncbi:MAG TPA: hypothetical protein VMT22_21820, partial [Terriglobales bacterium]|nr:hypothetical protein [Terriglobales bacterium]